jgi:hypothetical protein
MMNHSNQHTNNNDVPLRRPHTIKARRSTGGSCISAKTVGTASMTSCSTATQGSPSNRSSATTGLPLRGARRRHTTTAIPDDTHPMVGDNNNESSSRLLNRAKSTSHDDDNDNDNDDDDSLQDMLDHMIAESSAKWKSSVQTMQTSTMQLHHSSLSNSLDNSTSTTPMMMMGVAPPMLVTPLPSIAPLPLSRVASVEDLVRKQQEEIAVLRQAIQLSTTTTAAAAAASSPQQPPPPITHLSFPLQHHHSLDEHDELTVDLSMHY